MEDLGNWVAQRWGKIDRAFISLDASEIMLVVVRKGTMFDPDFEDELTDLDLSIFGNDAYRSIGFQSLALPNCPDSSVASYIDLKTALLATRP